MAASISSLFSQGLQFLKTPKYTTFVGIDIGSASIKMVQIKKDAGRLILETYGEIALGPYAQQSAGTLTRLAPEVIARAMADLAREAHITENHGTYGLASSSSLIFLLALPVVSDKQLESVVMNEARRYIPVPLAEVSINWWKIPQKETYGQEALGQEQKIEVLVAVTRNDAIANYEEIIKRSPIGRDSYEIEIFSTLRSSLHREIAPVMVVDFGASGTRVAIVEYGVVRRFSSFNRGGAYISESLAHSFSIPFDQAEQIKKMIGLYPSTPDQERAHQIILTSMNFLFQEIKTVMMQFEREEQHPIDKIILVGGGANMKGCLERMHQEFKVPVERSHAFSKTSAPAQLRDLLIEAGPEFACAVGLALRNVL
jgi:type IV pilus assembly protein PilM